MDGSRVDLDDCMQVIYREYGVLAHRHAVIHPSTNLYAKYANEPVISAKSVA